jgi:hypothetical protein
VAIKKSDTEPDNSHGWHQGRLPGRCDPALGHWHADRDDLLHYRLHEPLHGRPFRWCRCLRSHQRSGGDR